MQMALTDLAALLGHSRRVRNATVTGASIDSRTSAASQVFFAIRGPRFDGHNFVESALAQGAVAAVVEKGFFEGAAAKLRENLIPVADTVQAMQQLACDVRRRWGKKVVAVTGSTGKTTTKEMIAALLETKLKVLKSPGNLNNRYGLPLALLQLEASDEAAVVELAMSGPGEIARLARIAEPEIGVVTNVAPVHLEFFDSLDGITAAKRELIENLSPPGTAVLNFDDPRVREFRRGFDGQVVTFGFEEGADLRAVEMTSAGPAGSRFRLESRTLGGEFHLLLPGRHNVMNALAALAAASLFDIPENDCREALARFANLPQRSEILTLTARITLINDSYNSNPLAMERMLETLASWPAARRIVVAGEMLELGPTSPGWHRETGRKVAESGVDWLLAVQGDAQYLVQGASEAGLAAERLRFFPSAEAAAEFLAELVQPGDVILVKGSRGVHLEKVVEFLKLREMAEARLHGQVRGSCK
jgi:UDP-N-acetylmuramoyl-tripeptide--D-alanyl-D-alanine ligase